MTVVGSFTKQERAASVSQSFRTIYRFVRSLPLFRKLFLPTIVLSVIAVALPQIFLWLSGVYAACKPHEPCRTGDLPGGVQLTLSVGFLATFFVASFVFRLLSWVVFEIGGLWSLQDYHRHMVNGLARVRTTFFDEQPSGRLINRLVNDYEGLRNTCIVRIGDVMQALLEVLSIAIMVLIANPAGGILVVPAVTFSLYLQWAVAPMLQRLSAVRSIRLGEVIHRETDLIEGSPTFLAYGAEPALLGRLQKAVRRYVQVHLLRVRIEAWGKFFTSIVTSSYTFIAILLSAVAVQSGSISAVMGAAIVTIVLRLTPASSWLSWSVSFLIESVGVVKRTFEIVDLPDQTLDEFNEPRGPDAGDLPSTGTLTFDGYTMSYRSDTPVILDRLTFSIPWGSRVGIVGRTGSGKTSLFQSLFRMVYVHSGDITLGGVSLLSAPLERVRHLYSVVPQDPYLFEGSIQSNLDPEDQLDAQALAASLVEVGLSLPLDHTIEEGGRNLSLGERQLVCLARVLVQNRPFVLLDEPTSAVDNITDTKIQNALQHALRGRTTLTIAHRLDTIRDYDLVIRMSEGKILRMGKPQEVLPGLSEGEL